MNITTSVPLLQISDLTISYKTYNREVKAIRNVSLHLNPSEIVAVVGESGSGKSTLGLSIIHLLTTPPANYESGRVVFRNEDLLELKERELTLVRGTGISMIFQDPMSSLDPVYTVKDQLIEAIGVREGRKSKTGERSSSEVMGVSNAKEETVISSSSQVQVEHEEGDYTSEIVGVLKKVQIADPEQVLAKYPFELSGGMAQRVMIARALLQKPSLLIADEPTSALDVTTQAQVLDLMTRLRDEIGTSILFITHDLAVASQIADRVIVMYAGEIVEDGPIEQMFNKPLHPYTEGLIGSFAQMYKSEGKAQPITGETPDLRSIPSGCPFHPRCKYAFAACDSEHPLLTEVSDGHKVACLLRYNKSEQPANS